MTKHACSLNIHEGVLVTAITFSQMTQSLQVYALAHIYAKYAISYCNNMGTTPQIGAWQRG